MTDLKRLAKLKFNPREVASLVYMAVHNTDHCLDPEEDDTCQLSDGTPVCVFCENIEDLVLEERARSANLLDRVAKLEATLDAVLIMWEHCRTNQECGDGPCQPECDEAIGAARALLEEGEK